MDNISERVLNAFQEVLNVDKDQDTSLLIYNEFKGWDSVAHMALVAALELHFDCMLEMDDILELSSFEKALEIMVKYAK